MRCCYRLDVETNGIYGRGERSRITYAECQPRASIAVRCGAPSSRPFWRPLNLSRAGHVLSQASAADVCSTPAGSARAARHRVEASSSCSRGGFDMLFMASFSSSMRETRPFIRPCYGYVMLQHADAARLPAPARILRATTAKARVIGAAIAAPS